VDHRIFPPLDQRQIRIGTLELLNELVTDIVGSGSGIPSLARAEPHEYPLVILTALQLESPAVGAVGKNGIADVYQQEWLLQPSAILGGHIADQDSEEALQVGQGPSARAKLSPAATRRSRRSKSASGS
jgi:hypothetical protein